MMFKTKPHSYFSGLLLALALCFTFSFSASAQQRGLLWQISGKNVKGPTYLYGTVHLFDTTLYRLPQPVFAKLAQTKQAYFELDFDKIDPMTMMGSIMMQDTNLYLNKLLDAAALKKLKELQNSSTMLKMLSNNIYKVKPLFVLALLMNEAKMPSIDKELYQHARERKITVGGIETVDEQMAAMNAIPIRKQASMLNDGLKKFVSAKKTVAQMTGIYVKQNTATMIKDMSDNTPLDADFDETLITKRNILMADRIVPIIGKGSTMIAVGAGHLGGPKGLIALLKKKGYTLKNVPFEFVRR